MYTIHGVHKSGFFLSLAFCLLPGKTKEIYLDMVDFLQDIIHQFYPSITKELIKKAIGFAEKYITISDEDKELFLHTKKSFLFNNDQPWVKKENSSFDVTMGSYDGAETCELVDLYLLSLCTKLIPDWGQYRDDRLAVTRSTAR